jgi:plastocyanin
MDKKGTYAVPVTLLFLAIFLVIFIVLIYPSERAEILGYDSAGSYSVKISENGFSPSDLEIPAGARVTWSNQDNSQHTITFLDSKSNVINPGGSYSKKFDDSGSFTYTSDYNPSFRGTIKVT